MSSSFEQIDDQHVTYRVRRRKSFMSNKVVKGLKEKMSEVLIATSNKCQKMKSWSSDQNSKLAEVVRKFKGKNQIEKKKNEESAEKYDDETLSKDSMLKRLHELDKKLEKTMERVGVLETVFERELVRRCTTIKDEDERMSDSDDESESGYCTPA